MLPLLLTATITASVFAGMTFCCYLYLVKPLLISMRRLSDSFSEAIASTDQQHQEDEMLGETYELDTAPVGDLEAWDAGEITLSLLDETIPGSEHVSVTLRVPEEHTEMICALSNEADDFEPIDSESEMELFRAYQFREGTVQSDYEVEQIVLFPSGSVIAILEQTSCDEHARKVGYELASNTQALFVSMLCEAPLTLHGESVDLSIERSQIAQAINTEELIDEFKDMLADLTVDDFKDKA